MGGFNHHSYPVRFQRFHPTVELQPYSSVIIVIPSSTIEVSKTMRMFYILFHRQKIRWNSSSSLFWTFLSFGGGYYTCMIVTICFYQPTFQQMWANKFILIQIGPVLLVDVPGLELVHIKPIYTCGKSLSQNRGDQL